MLKTPRITFNPITAADFDFLFEHLSDEEQTRYLPLGKPYPKNKVKAYLSNRLSHWQQYGFGTFILSLTETGEPIGYCGLEYVLETDFIDIRYGLVKPVWGQGLAFEAAFASVTYGFESLQLDEIYGAAVPENKASITVLKKLGMTPSPHFDIYGDAVDSFSVKKAQFLEIRPS
ncbi:GNAT family N-acetyltransferase [Endozoicomonas sp. SM1973]|uniref:GNAT family N-acetyltransferase n=1 Tax=Spartinivicinus marinus TaxID=2994442 RepID=A0A853I2S9_9GAMM|nr:GNAT family N-acetyltransferase [Spartinivicinus marinus]MCX4029710.1 GNAT family N-acetyltransferase [Spartinivicinus marinus]NYZ66909.1 GNAT family N-acetyltransferase [Spartinivicinus marinus]